MNRTQLDRWFALSDRVDRLISRNAISQADASSLLKPVREVADLDVEKELSIAERQIASVERTGVLLGSAESLASTQSQERCDAFFASRTNR